MFTSDDAKYSRSSLDGFEFLFSDRRGRDSRQIWNIDTNKGDDKKKRYCFRKVRRRGAVLFRAVWRITHPFFFFFSTLAPMGTWNIWWQWPSSEPITRTCGLLLVHRLLLCGIHKGCDAYTNLASP